MKYQFQQVVDLPVDSIFNVLSDIANYQNFVPLCKKSVVLDQSDVGDGCTHLKVQLHFFHKKYGIDVSTLSNVQVDVKNQILRSETATGDQTGYVASNVCYFEKLGEHQTRIEFEANYKSKHLLTLFLPKKPFINMVSNKFTEAAVSYARKRQKSDQQLRSSNHEPGLDEKARDEVLSKLPKNGIGAELGVYLGAFSDELLKIVVPKKIHLVDPWKSLKGKTYQDSWYSTQSQDYMDSLHDIVCQRFRPAIETGQVEVHRCTSVEFLKSMADNSLDWVYIDADHSYDAVVQDLKCSFEKVKSGGMIAGDDYRIAGWWKDAIVKAVNEFCASYPVELVLELHGQFVIVKK